MRLGRRGPQLRAFSKSAAVRHRGYSQRLQRVMVDFGAEHSFAKAAERVREHYGIEVPTVMARAITEKHGARMAAQEKLEAVLPGKPGVKQLIGEMDGSVQGPLWD